MTDIRKPRTSATKSSKPKLSRSKIADLSRTQEVKGGRPPETWYCAHTYTCGKGL